MYLLKTNPYNLLIPVEERGEFLLYNNLTGGMEVLAREEGICMAELMTLRSFDRNIHFKGEPEMLDHWIDREYIIPSGSELVKALEKHTDETQFKDPGSLLITIGTTITCNMGCAYCFEFVKPNHTLKDEKVKKQIIEYVEDIILQKRYNIHTIKVMWYGGEPLINMKAITDVSNGLVAIAEKYQLNYGASVVTNGIYLTEENVKMLVDCKVDFAQVTLDGAQSTHDVKRPLKQANAENYTRIMRNLAALPPELNVMIRMNVDKEVAATIEEMMDDMNSYGMWPQRNKQFAFETSWMRPYEEIKLTTEAQDKFMYSDEFFDFKQHFRWRLIERYNEWASANNLRPARLKWDLPEYQSTCATWASPLSLVIDPKGNIHKCWETIHDEGYAPTSVFEKFEENRFSYYHNFNRYTHNMVCRNCKFLPSCDTINCSFEAIKYAVPICTQWKYRGETYIRDQYMRMKEYPDTINVPLAANTASNTGHANK